MHIFLQVYTHVTVITILCSLSSESTTFLKWKTEHSWEFATDQQGE